MNNEFLVIRKTRSIAEILRISYLYFSVQGGPMLKALFLFALPVIVASSFIATRFSHNSRAFSQILHMSDSMQGDDYLMLIALYFAFACGIGLFNLIINKQLALNESTYGEKIGFVKLKTGLADDFRSSFSNFIILFVIYFIVKEIASSIVEDLDMLLFIVGCLLFLPIIIYGTLSVTYIGFREKTDIKGALKKVITYAQNRPSKAWLGSTVLFLVTYASYLMLKIFFNYVYFLIGFLIGYNESNDALANLMSVIQMLEQCFIFVFIAHFQVAVVYLNGSIEDETEGHYIQRKMDRI